MKRIIKSFVRILTVAIFLFTLYLLVFGTLSIKNNKLINVFGYSYSYVPTSSMDSDKVLDAKVETIKQHSYIIIKFDDYESLEINDVIVFKSSDEILIVHRIVERVILDDQVFYKTKGDNNSSVDNDLVSIYNYQGKVVKATYLLGLGKLFTNSRNLIFLIITIIILIILVFQIYEIVKNKHQKPDLSDEDINKLVEERLKGMK